MRDRDFYRWMDGVGFFNGSECDMSYELADEFFTEESFRQMGYDDDDFEAIADELDMDDGIDWGSIQYQARRVLDDWFDDYARRTGDIEDDAYEYLEWGDKYSGDLPELDPDDFDTKAQLEEADADRRRQFWLLTGTVATSRDAWEKYLDRHIVNREKAEEVARRFRDLMADEDNYWPIDCHLSYERGDGYDDPFDSIEGAGHYSVVDL